MHSGDQLHERLNSYLAQFRGVTQRNVHRKIICQRHQIGRLVATAEIIGEGDNGEKVIGRDAAAARANRRG